MVPNLTLEVIYYKEPTDFKMEFDLCGNCNLRFLSFSAKDKKSFISALANGVARSRVIMAVGDFSKTGNEYLPKIIADAIGYELKPIKSEGLAVQDGEDYTLPESAIPLVTENGILGGCVLESNDQAIILLTNEKKLRHKIINELICPYLQIFAKKELGHSKKVAKEEVNPEIEAEITEVQNQPEDVVESAEQPKPESADFNGEESATEISQTEAVSTDEAGGNNILELSTEKFTAEAILSMVAEDEANAEIDTTGEKEKSETEEDEPQEIKTEEVKTEETETEETEETLPEDDFDIKKFFSLPEKNENDFSYTLLAEPETENEAKQNLETVLEEEYEKELLEFNKRRKKKIIKVIVSFLIIIAVLLSAFFGYEWVYQPAQNQSVYTDVRELYGQTWEGLPENMLHKFGKLYQTNSDIYGWISIPESNINYPVVSSSKKGSKYYEGHSFEGSVNRFGTLHTDCEVENYEYQANTVIYGSGSKEGAMFDELDKYTDIEHYRLAPVFSFDSVYTENRWKIFAVIKINNVNKSKYIRSEFFNDEEFLNYVDFIKSSSLITTEIDVVADDKLVTLVSNSGEDDIVVVARRVRDNESPLVDTENQVYENLLPDVGSEISEPSYTELTEITSSEEAGSTEGNALADGSAERFEQSEMISEEIEIEVKPLPAEDNTSSAEMNVSSGISSAVSSETSSSPSSDVASGESVLSSSGESSVSSDITSSETTPEVTVKLPTITVINDFDKKKYTGPANEIVAQILEAEMGSHYHIEALKAQAVATYSWLLCNGADSGKTPNAPMKTAGSRAIQAANEVAGEVAVYNGKIAQTYYYAISAGKTANSSDIWTNQLAYLVSVDSSVDKNVSGYETIRKYSADDVQKWVKAEYNIDLSSVEKSKWFTCTYDQNGLYVKTVIIGDKSSGNYVTVKGPALRNQLFTAARVGSANVLRSSAYQITYDNSENKFIFTVKGYGHGVGMSQTGANAYAKAGWDYRTILQHYYTGITFGMYLDE